MMTMGRLASTDTIAHLQEEVLYEGPDDGESGNPDPGWTPWPTAESAWRNILQATGFVMRLDKTIAVSQYSSGPIGRLVWQDILGLVQFYKKAST
jgi:hypothetical protein